MVPQHQPQPPPPLPLAPSLAKNTWLNRVRGPGGRGSGGRGGDGGVEGGGGEDLPHEVAGSTRPLGLTGADPETARPPEGIPPLSWGSPSEMVRAFLSRGAVFQPEVMVRRLAADVALPIRGLAVLSASELIPPARAQAAMRVWGFFSAETRAGNCLRDEHH